ncbi:response regulator [Ferruginibacter albus]|uniref:response regulator n=1 Tax=Ferruginibacter albus TaxID=2875540 RepID=UPI001CC333A0|nr:response regulator [Ferruginibacter albus]UAY53082.1 response regulator [Ferruginibacter albus]
MADILLLEDNIDMLKMFQMLFKYKGMGLRSVANESCFLKELSKQKPDLIILDILLRDSDGRQICLDLKSNCNTKDIPVIMMSVSPKLLGSCKGICGEDYLEKPFDIKELFDKINLYIKVKV